MWVLRFVVVGLLISEWIDGSVDLNEGLTVLLMDVTLRDISEMILCDSLIKILCSKSLGNLDIPEEFSSGDLSCRALRTIAFESCILLRRLLINEQPSLASNGYSHR